MPAPTRAASGAARGNSRGGGARGRGRGALRCTDTSTVQKRRSPRLVEAEQKDKTATPQERRTSVKAAKSDDDADSDFGTSESRNSSSGSGSSSRNSSSGERPRRRRGSSKESRGWRDRSPIVEIWEEEEEDDETALKREAQGFVRFEDGRVFYRTYTTTELIDSDTKVKGRQTQVQVGDFADLMVARSNTKDRSILYRFAQILAIYQEAPSGYIPPETDECPSGAPPTGKKRKRQPAGDQGGNPGVNGPLRFEVRWVFDAQDLKRLGGYSASGTLLGSDEFAESDRCECVPAEWLDEEAMVLRDRGQYEEETERRERIEREGGSDEHLPPLCLITHFYCSRTNMLMPIGAVDDDKNQLLLSSSRFHRVYVDEQQEKDACSGLKELTPVQRAIRRLQLDSVPATLPCRTREFQRVRQTILTGITQKQGGEILYISGLPGTGKTATVQSVLKSLQQDMEAKMVPPFTCIELNAMRLQHPDLVFVALYRRLFGCKPQSIQHAFAALDRHFTGESHADTLGQWQDTPKKRQSIKLLHKSDYPIVLVVDEVDCLISAKQRVLYTLFDWPFHASSRLVLVAIANTIDLPEKILNSRCASRIGFGRLTFNPYTSDQIETIILDRLQDCRELFADAAIKVCARKIANFYGDLRRAMQVLRRSLESLEGGKKIHPADINSAANDLFESPLKDSITCLPRGVKLLLYCLLKSQRHSDAGVPLRSLRDSYQTLIDVGQARLNEEQQVPAAIKTPPIEFEDIKTMLDSLAGMRVVEVYLHLPREEMPLKALKPDKSSRQTAQVEGSLKIISVDPIIDEAGGDTEVAIIAPMDELATVFLKDADLEGLPL